MPDACRHYGAGEHVLDFSLPGLGARKFFLARRLFEDMAAHARKFEKPEPYKMVTLVEVVYDHAVERGRFLHRFFERIDTGTSHPGEVKSADRSMAKFAELSLDSSEPIEDVMTAFETFAEYIYNYLIVPVLANAARTQAVARAMNQPDPSVQSDAAVSIATGTTSRAYDFRDKCLTRDYHRCLMTGKFDHGTAYRRLNQSGPVATDDFGELLKDTAVEFEPVEAAHILPHSLLSTPVDTDGALVCLRFDLIRPASSPMNTTLTDTHPFFSD